MTTTSSELLNVAREVSRAWSPLGGNDAQLTPITGGFSGACVFQLTFGKSSPLFALRAWPVGYREFDRLWELHRFLKFLQLAGLPVPSPYPVHDTGTAIVRGAQRIWQLEPWLPGTPIDLTHSEQELKNTMHTLARMHLVAERYEASPAGTGWCTVGHGPCPSIEERLTTLKRWSPEALSRRLARTSDDASLFLGVESAAKGNAATILQLQPRMLHCFLRLAPEVERQLLLLRDTDFRLHPCWRDLWNAHVLLEEEQVSGFIDAAATRTEHVGTDLSRLLGSLFGNDQSRWEAALAAYTEIRDLSPSELQLMQVLDRSGLLLSGMTWLSRSISSPELLGPDELARWQNQIERMEDLP